MEKTMQHFETSYTSNDGLELYSQSWLPVGEPKAAVCLVQPATPPKGGEGVPMPRPAGLGARV